MNAYIVLGKGKDITGRRYGKLVTLGPVDKTLAGQVIWLCRCDCGNQNAIRATDLIEGRYESCEVCRNLEKSLRCGGQREHPLYATWRGMWRRCTDKSNNSYKNYGARGITVCDEWRDFERFIHDMGAKPDGYTLDRIDNNAGYSRENCKWSTWKSQHRNRRNNRMVEHEGRMFCVAELAEKLNVSYTSIYEKLR